MATLTSGQIVRRTRERLGYSRDRLAYEAGVSTSMVVRLELSNRVPNAHALARITQVLGLPMEEILSASTPPKPRSRKRVSA